MQEYFIENNEFGISRKFCLRKYRIFLLPVSIQYPADFILTGILGMQIFHCLTHLSLASHLWDIGKQNSPRCDATERGVSSGAILFA